MITDNQIEERVEATGLLIRIVSMLVRRFRESCGLVAGAGRGATASFQGIAPHSLADERRVLRSARRGDNVWVRTYGLGRAPT